MARLNRLRRLFSTSCANVGPVPPEQRLQPALQQLLRSDMRCRPLSSQRFSGAQDGSQHLSFIHLEVVPKAAEAFVAGDLLNGGQIHATLEGTCGE